MSILTIRKSIKQAILNSQQDDNRNPGEKQAALYIRAGLQQALMIVDADLESEQEARWIAPLVREPVYGDLFSDSGT